LGAKVIQLHTGWSYWLWN